MADQIPYTDDKIRSRQPGKPSRPGLPGERPVVPRGKPTPPVNPPGSRIPGTPVDRPGNWDIKPIETPDKPTSGQSPGWSGKNPFPPKGPGNRPGPYPIKKRRPVMPEEPQFRNAARKKLMGMKGTDSG